MKKGIAFKYPFFAGTVQVGDRCGDSVQVVLTGSDDNSWVETWNYNDMLSKFKSGYYEEVKEDNSISIW